MLFLVFKPFIVRVVVFVLLIKLVRMELSISSFGHFRRYRKVFPMLRCSYWYPHWWCRVSVFFVSPYFWFPGFMRSGTSLFVTPAVHGIWNDFHQPYVSNTSIPLQSAFLSVQLSHPYVVLRKMMALTSLLLVVRVKCLLLEILFMPTIAVQPNVILRLIYHHGR